MPLVLSKAVAATAVSAAVATTPSQQLCYYVPTNHVFWNRIETVMEVVCVLVPQPLNETKWSER